MSEPLKINALSVTAIKNVKAKMRADPAVAASVPIAIRTEFDPTTGMVKGPKGLVAAPMPHSALDSTDPNLPTPLTYCPMAASACYALVYMIECANRGIPLESYKYTSDITANMAMFYSLDAAKQGCKPWEKVDLNVKIQGDPGQETLDELGVFAHQHCPASTMLQSGGTVIATSCTSKEEDQEQEANTTTTTVETDNNTDVINGYDMRKYKLHAAKILEDAKHGKIHQQGSGEWFCQNQCKDFPDAVMQMFTSGKDLGIATSMDPPIGDGKYPNPIANCFFGAAAFYAHTFATRLSLRGVAISSLVTTVSTNMNKRKMMAVDEDVIVFDKFNFNVEVGCNNPDPELLEEVRKEVDLMCPSIYGMSKPIAFEVVVEKV